MKLQSLLVLVPFAVLLSAMGCESKMDPKECDKLRGAAFDLTNKGQRCNTDADCRIAEWPSCANPVSNETWDKIKPSMDAFRGGKCEEPTVPCNKPKDIYCKQGLCIFREKGTPEGADNTPTDQIIIK